MASLMRISAIASNFNGARYLPKLLETLKGQAGVELQIIIVDRHSTDGSDAILAQHSDVLVVKEPPESGLVAGYAAGFPHARHDLLFFSNEDMWFEPDCLRLVAEQFQAEERVGGVMPIQRSYDGERLVQAGSWFQRTRWYRDNPNPRYASVFRDVNVPEPISGINAGACMLTRAAYEDVGGWDPTFFLDYEDTDISVRLWQHGWRCRIQPRAVVYHAVGASNGHTLGREKTPVSMKRYSCALSNQVVVAMKTFTGTASLAAPALLADRMLRNFLKRRWDLLPLDVKAVELTARRLPDVLRYRRANRTWNERRPGQGFFSDPQFDLNAPRERAG
jgi:N-acetylglucosaminyl-diphospho-decaprenol L-rhamnosyltransferase